jgi:branched-chain amino acid transport system substrate-binding protein
MIATKTLRHKGKVKELGKQKTPLRYNCLLIFLLSALCLGVSVVSPFAFSQEAGTAPYASINRDSVTYNGPGRDPHHDLAGTTIRIGMLLPLSGPRQAIGTDWQRAAQMAIDDENTTCLSNCRLDLVTRDENGPWGRVSTQIASLIFDDQAVAVITSTDGDSAHLAEQMANKIGVPIVTLSGDSTTTEINLPWIFRLGPSDAVQAETFAREIYERKGLGRVLLICQNDHDGRFGGEAFIRIAEKMKAVEPAQIQIDPELMSDELSSKNIAGAQAVVVWADAPTTRPLLAQLDGLQPDTPIFLSRKSVEDEPMRSNDDTSMKPNESGRIWIVGRGSGSPSRVNFCHRYRQRFGVDPTVGAAEAYDAVRVLGASLRQSGPNRTRLRDRLSAISEFGGASGIISFDHAGNDTSPVALLKIK